MKVHLKNSAFQEFSPHFQIFCLIHLRTTKFIIHSKKHLLVLMCKALLDPRDISVELSSEGIGKLTVTELKL